MITEETYLAIQYRDNLFGRGQKVTYVVKPDIKRIWVSKKTFVPKHSQRFIKFPSMKEATRDVKAHTKPACINLPSLVLPLNDVRVPPEDIQKVLQDIDNKIKEYNGLVKGLENTKKALVSEKFLEFKIAEVSDFPEHMVK